MICFFDYIFYRSYINLYKTKYKDYAVPRSIGFVLLLPLMVLYSIVIITNTLFRLYDYGYSIDRRILAIFIIPLVLIVWHFTEKHFKKYSKDNYLVLRTRFNKSKYNKLIPFWLIFIFPFVLLFGVPFILSLLN